MATANRETSCHHCGGVLNQFLLKSWWRVQKLSSWFISAVVISTKCISPHWGATSLKDKDVLLTAPSVHEAPLPICFHHFIPCFNPRSLSQLWQLNRGLPAFKAAARLLPSDEWGECVGCTCSCSGHMHNRCQHQWEIRRGRKQHEESKPGKAKAPGHTYTQTQSTPNLNRPVTLKWLNHPATQTYLRPDQTLHLRSSMKHTVGKEVAFLFVLREWKIN